MSRRQLSVVIIARDEERRLPACLESVAFADEVVVVDSGSADATPALAASRGCRVVHREWAGYGAQKRFAVSQASHDWVLCVDADERVSDQLRESIRAALQQPAFDAYVMPRRNRFLGRWLRHGEGYPDLSLRLFDRRHAQWTDDPVHERVVADGSVGRLSGDLLHESQETLQRYLEKQNRYTTLQAERLAASPRRVGVLQLVGNPLARFVKMYLLRGGFLDGLPGLIHVLVGCYNSMVKYAKVIELRSGRARRQ